MTGNKLFFMGQMVDTIPHPEVQYLALCQAVVDHGVWIENERTKKRCKMLPSATIVLDVENGPFPAITTRKAPIKMPVAEKFGYLIGLDNAADFEAVGAKTWYANANETPAWLANPNRKGEDDLGRIYGVQGRKWLNYKGEELDQLKRVVADLKQGIDNRGEIITYWNPGELDEGCLRPCMHTHTFTLTPDGLYLASEQRSADLPLGTVANMQQVYFLLKLVAQMAGVTPKLATLHMTNAHIYDNQYDLMVDIQLKREPYLDVHPELIIDPAIQSVEDLDTWVKPSEHFKVVGYDKWHEPIKYPFAA